ncbi:FAD-binding oxidoreductase [Gulosibacter faecalis]|uniref:FAD-binding oxidoreductase n=1 Tax=Gulosibacter faecalis TaxID=272240 RepID=A0ABW5UZ90_9MICO|nr:FAD-linked oxidase C-terminal domain-containing protein [Gulosibacter faecalis]
MSTTAPALPQVSTATPDDVAALVAHLAEAHPDLDVRAASTETAGYAYDQGTLPARLADEVGPAVALPDTVEQVQAVVRAAAEYGVAVVPRGAGTGLSGGAAATTAELVVSTERLTRILEVSPDDELAVVEAGVLNADLSSHVAPLGLFYAPDPASWDISSIGGNVATNAGGLRCVKYGVTRESVLALDVVLADGELVSVGSRTLKSVTGLDLRGLFIGAEGILGIVVRATVRLRPVPVARRTVTAFFDTVGAGTAALAAITRSSVRPSITEFLDGGTLRNIDAHNGTDLAGRGDALLLIELDGYGIDEQYRDLDAALTAVGGRVSAVDDAEAERLWELRRSGRGFPADQWFAGGDVAVPKSTLPEVYAYFDQLRERYGVDVSAVAHAGDGNLHPVITLQIPEGADPNVPSPALAAANDDLVRFALSLGGTVTGEHGLGSTKRGAAALELSSRNLEAQYAVKAALDPHGLLNPGKAI